MYAIYRCDRRIPELVAVCYTKIGTKRACAHFRRIVQRETCREIEVRYEPIILPPALAMRFFALIAAANIINWFASKQKSVKRNRTALLSVSVLLPSIKREEYIRC